MERTRLYDVKLSRLPQAVGLCAADTAGVARYVNAATRQLLYSEESGDDGWWGTWAEMAFVVSQTQHYITLPREVARLDLLSVCGKPVPVRNQFYEYLAFGNGLMPKLCGNRSHPVQAYPRNNVPVFTDPTSTPFTVRVYATDSADVDSAARVLVQGLDTHGAPVYSLDGEFNVLGEYVTLAAPFADSLTPLNTITGIQKDITIGALQLFWVDGTGNQTLMLTMEPGEETASYRRYLINPVPCCCDQIGPLTIKGIAKLDFVPVAVDSDYCLIQNIEALTEQAQAIRYSEMDSANAKLMAQDRHRQAVKLLNGELRHYLGYESAAITVPLFGSNKLRPSFV